MPVVRSVEVQAVRIREAVRIAITRRHYDDHRLPLPDLFAAEHDIVGRDAGGVLAGALVAEQFLHGCRHDIRLGPEAVHFPRVAQEGEHPVPDQVRRGLQAPHHRDDAVGHDLLVSEAVAVHLGREQGTEEAVPRLSALLGDRALEVGRQVLDGRQNACEPVRVVLEVAEHLGEGDRPSLELGVVLDRYAEQLVPEPRARTSSINLSAMAWMCGLRVLTRAGWNAGPASRRSRVCAGASRNSICLTITRATGLTSGTPSASKYSGPGAQLAENRRRTLLTSS